MDKPVAIAISLSVIVLVLVLSMIFLWGMTKQLASIRDHHHADLLRKNAKRLEDAGYLEAAQHFREYADIVEAPAEERERLGR